jgi:hypothetical protein
VTYRIDNAAFAVMFAKDIELNYCGSLNHAAAAKLLINTSESEDSALAKQMRLAKIAEKTIAWKKLTQAIAEKIDKSGGDLLGYSEVTDLMANIKKDIIEVLEKELHEKLALKVKPTMRAKLYSVAV